MYFYVFFLILLVQHGHTARILGVYNHPGASHTTLGKILFKELARRGHDVTMISAFPLEKPLENYTDIYLEGFLEDLKRRQTMYFGNKMSIHEQTKNMSLQHTMDTFENPKVKDLLNSKATFDVIIMDYFFNEGTLILGHHFKAPVIVMCSFGNNVLLNSMTGNYLPMAYVPGLSFLAAEELSFTQRTILGIVNVVLPVFQHLRILEHERMLKKYFTHVPSVNELRENVALVLSNSHFSFETPRPYTPNVIPVGGFHVQDVGSLPKDLKTFLDKATEGVIFFSLGSQIRTLDLAEGALEAISKAFSQLPQKIIWKWESDDKPSVSKNVRLEKWLPQKEILNHPNVKVFITHGGVLSTIEAIHFEVPLLCIPFNGDQPTTAAFIRSRGFGLFVQPKEITEEKMVDALTQLLQNPSYKKNAEYYSDVLRNQPLKPLETAVYWVEHVIKHKGAPHLKPFSLRLAWYQNYMLDVIGFIVLALLVAIWFILKILRCTFKISSLFICKLSKLFRKSVDSNKDKQKKLKKI